MMLTTKGRYAVMAVLDIASRTEHTPSKLSDISNNQQIPLNYLEQIFSRLKNSGIVKSVKGPGGGYFIYKDLDKISIVEIIDAVEENIKITRCNGIDFCAQGKKCNTHDLWDGLGKVIRSYLSSVSVKDVLSSDKNMLIQLQHITNLEKLEQGL